MPLDVLAFRTDNRQIDSKNEMVQMKQVSFPFSRVSPGTWNMGMLETKHPNRVPCLG